MSLKKTAYGVEFVVLGIESQQHIHYAMPLRHMVYDAMSYLKEYQEITRKYKKDTGKKTEDEFLSKMKKNEKEYLELQDELKYIQKLKKSVALSLKDMSTYESKEIKTSTKV